MGIYIGLRVDRKEQAMNKHDDGGPAFPLDRMLDSGEGLTKREWYAGMALATIDLPGSTVEVIACVAFALADEMLERSKR